MATAIPSTNAFHPQADDRSDKSYCLIWLDASTNEKEVRDTAKKLRTIMNRLKTFQDVEECQEYIKQRSHKDRIVMIVSGRLGQEIVPSIHNYNQILSIYVYCMDKASNQKWANKFSKIKAVVVQLDELILRIMADHRIQEMIEEPLLFGFFSTSTNSGSTMTGVNGPFVFAQVLIDCLLRLKPTEADKEELINCCKQLYEDDSIELNNIRQFEQNYSSTNVLGWYTKESFFYQTLNKALREQDVHMMFLFRKYICDIHRQLEKYRSQNSVRVYRGQMMPKSELTALQQFLNQFISVNSFFSTTTDARYARSFFTTPGGRKNLQAVLFEIDATPNKNTTKPFADISTHSQYQDEYEILFMVGSIFRLNDISYNNNLQAWSIHMTFSNYDEHDLKQVIVEIKQQLGSENPNLQTFGKILWEMGKFDLAAKYFIRLLDQLSADDPLRGSLYQDLGTLESQLGHWNKSIEWRQKASAFKNQYQLTFNSSIDTSNNSLGASEMVKSEKRIHSTNPHTDNTTKGSSSTLKSATPAILNKISTKESNTSATNSKNILIVVLKVRLIIYNKSSVNETNTRLQCS